MKKSIKLKDGVKENAKYPSSFFIPTKEEKDAVKPGDFVKLIFSHKGSVERMWVLVTGTRRGTLSNQPYVIPLNHGDAITYSDDNIIGIMSNEDQVVAQEALLKTPGVES